MSQERHDGKPAAAWPWAEQREKRSFLALEDGTVLRGYSVGARQDAVGEVVFNTGMSGYQEILSDPSYRGQFVTMTYPEIGNTGVNVEDRESCRVHANGFIVHQMNAPSNWRATESLSDMLENSGVPAIAGVDTRALTTLLREKGTLKGYLSVGGPLRRLPDLPDAEAETGLAERDGQWVGEDDAISLARRWPGLDGQDYASRVSCSEPYAWDPDGKETCSWGMAESLPTADLKIVAYDFGIKWNILRGLRRSGMTVTVVPARTPATDVLAMKPDGVFLSNGPADPAAVSYAARTASELLGKLPLMGICLGHQLLGLAVGGRTYRLKFGHHGCNHPVMDLSTREVEITSQNHNFAVDTDSLDPSVVEVTHVNLNDDTVEGLRHRREPMFCVQYHPEACPGPHDPFYLFQRFRSLIEAS